MHDSHVDLRRKTYPVRLFLRFSALGGTLFLPLLGAASVSARLEGQQIIGIICVGFAFHGFSYVLNDIVDLDIDRSEPRRAEFPLVVGTVQPWQALAFVLLQVPLAMVITAWLGGDARSFVVLGIGFLLMAIYDLSGKRTKYPPVTDAAQGLAWAALVLYGATIAPGNLSGMTFTIVAYVFVFILLANGVHGGLRDLANDSKCGVRTTAIFLGAQPRGTSGLLIPRPLILYTAALQAILIFLLFTPLVFNWLGYGVIEGVVTWAMVIACSVLQLRLLMTAVRSAPDGRQMTAPGMLHLLLALIALLALFALHLDPLLRLALLAVFLVPLLTHSWLFQSLRWSWRQLRATLQPTASLIDRSRRQAFKSSRNSTRLEEEAGGNW